jgi:uncharacterized protein YlaN (UPF0358 family)
LSNEQQCNLVETLAACSVYAEVCDEETQALKREITGLNELLDVQTEEISRLQTKDKKLVNNPWFWGTIGLAALIVSGLAVK